MIPGQVDYARPGDLQGVLEALQEHDGGAKILAGGHSLLPLLKFRLAEPTLLVDVRDVTGLDSIEEADGELRIGGLATHRIIHEHPLTAGYPLIRDAVGGIGDAQVRNWGTLGGSCAHADPSSDWPAVLLAYSAAIVCRSASGERVIPAREFFLDTFTTAIEPTEMLTQVRIPKPPAGSGGAYQKLERRAGDFASVGAAVQLTLGSDGRVDNVGIGLTAVAESPFAATDAEAALQGQVPDDTAVHAAGEAAAAQSRPTTDSHGPADYKRAMVAEMTVRAVRRAIERAAAAQ